LKAKGRKEEKQKSRRTEKNNSSSSFRTQRGISLICGSKRFGTLYLEFDSTTATVATNNYAIERY